MTPEQTRQAEMTLVLMMHKLSTRKHRREACKFLNVPWDEYQFLKEKYKHLLKRYDFEKYKEGGRKDVL